MPSTSLTFSTCKCYACDSTRAVGVRDRRPEGGVVEAACQRHYDPTIKAHASCLYCSGPRPSTLVGNDFAHKKCHAEASR
jgi:hypothetical protein